MTGGTSVTERVNGVVIVAQAYLTGFNGGVKLKGMAMAWL